MFIILYLGLKIKTKTIKLESKFYTLLTFLGRQEVGFMYCLTFSHFLYTTILIVRFLSPTGSVLSPISFGEMFCPPKSVHQSTKIYVKVFDKANNITVKVGLEQGHHITETVYIASMEDAFQGHYWSESIIKSINNFLSHLNIEII